MGTILIQDLGTKTFGGSTTDELDMVSGTITLYNASISYSIKTIIDKTDEVLNYRVVSGDSQTQAQERQYVAPSISAVGVSAPTITISGTLDNTIPEDLHTIGLLNRLAKTKGFKKISGDDIIKYLFYDEVGEVDGVYGLVVSFVINKDNTSENLMKYTISFVITKLWDW